MTQVLVNLWGSRVVVGALQCDGSAVIYDPERRTVTRGGGVSFHEMSPESLRLLRDEFQIERVKEWNRQWSDFVASGGLRAAGGGEWAQQLSAALREIVGEEMRR